MQKSFYTLMEDNPVIAAVKDENGLADCIACAETEVVFILYGDICSIGKIVDTVKHAGKTAIIHMDRIDGLMSKETSIEFIKDYIGADGIISTKSLLVKRAKELGLYAILRIFILDSMAFENIKKQLKIVRPDALEILPGLMPKVIQRVSRITRIPIIAGGLISEKEDVFSALSAGASCVSSTNSDVWKA